MARQFQAQNIYLQMTQVKMKEPTLTIGIPTYNRCEAVTSNLKHLQDSNLAENIKILVIDNCSLDDSYESLLKISNFETTRIVRNDQNIGYARNFVKLFKECDTDYLLITSDEDYIITENLPNLLEFIKTTSADFISPQAIIKDKVYRGKPNNLLISPLEYRSSCNYISGITYKISSCLAKIKMLEIYLNKSLEVAEIYPQILLSAMIILTSKAYWYCQPISYKVFQLPSDITKKHKPYYFLNSRWLQYSSHIDFFIDLLNHQEYHQHHNEIKQMLEFHLSGLKGWILDGIAKERKDIPELATYFNNPNQKIQIYEHQTGYHFTIINESSNQ